MADFTTGTAIWPRLAAQDRHVPKESVPLALSSFGPRRGGRVRITIHSHMTPPAAKSAI